MFVWTPSDAVYAAFVLIIMSVYIPFAIHRAWRQWRCKHQGRISETSACDAICYECGKNLGFIGSWRYRQAAEQREGGKG